MNTYARKVQFSECYADEFRQKGHIEKEQAVEEFQLFPWDKEIDDYRRRKDDPTVPKIIFISDDNRQLVISAKSDKGFEFVYSDFRTGKCWSAYLSNNFSDESITPEEVIGFFFDNTLASYVKLKDLPKSEAKEPVTRKTPSNIVFHFRHSFRPLFTFRFFVWLVLFAGLSFVITRDAYFPRWVLLMFIFTWPVPLFVHLTYYLKNAGARVVIDTGNYELTFIKGKREIRFGRDEIFRCQITYSGASKMSLCDGYSYVWFILQDRTYVVITHFIADPEAIVEALKCRYETRASGALLPLL